MRVLLVEDDEPVAVSLRRGLLRYGFQVEWVTTGHAALAHQGPYDVPTTTSPSPSAYGRSSRGPGRWYGPRLTVDRKAARVRRDGVEVVLAPKEYDLLAFLTEEPGALMSGG